MNVTKDTLTAAEWNGLVEEHSPVFGAFLQSYEWGEFMKSIGREVVRVHATNGSKQMIAQAIKMPLPLGKHYWMISKGPLGTMGEANMIAALRQSLTGGMFYRIEPEIETRLKKTGDVQPSSTIIVDLEKSEEEVLAAMKSKTRYNIRLSDRKGVESRFVDINDHRADFERIKDQTAARDGIKLHSTDYYINQLKALSEDQKASDNGAVFRLAMAFYEGRPIAANIICDFAGMRTYVHGATSNLHRNVMAQYHLHYFLMKDAIEQGIPEFDFWGVAVEGNEKSQQWSGITRYKMGFGGAMATVPGTVDLPIEHLWYGLYGAAKKVMR